MAEKTKEQESRHTPGPWYVDTTAANGCYGVWKNDDDGMRQIASTFPNNHSDFCREERDANTKLIAKAPEMLSQNAEMLAMLKEMEHYLRMCNTMFVPDSDSASGMIDRQLAKYAALIAKVEGSPQ